MKPTTPLPSQRGAARVAARALIAEDEPLLAENLRTELARLWPELEVVATVSHGAAAVEHALALAPDVVFLDIRMPGMSGLDAAQAIAEDWPDDGGAAAFPLVVFVTAYDEYAIDAFDRAAVDYLLKPVLPERLAQTCGRLQTALTQRDDAFDATLARLRSLLAVPDAPAAPAAERLSVLPVGVGDTVRMVPVASVVYFEAADKYVRVVTADAEYLIRTSLRELLPQLDPRAFWQIHRGTVVRADAIASALRDESGKLTLTLTCRPDRLAVSRLYAQRFKAL